MSSISVMSIISAPSIHIDNHIFRLCKAQNYRTLHIILLRCALSVCIKIYSVYVQHKNPRVSLLWRHNGCDGVSNHQPHDCLLNRSFMCRSKKTSKLRVTGLCVGNSPVTGEFPAQMASNAENVSIWWRHHLKPVRRCSLMCDMISQSVVRHD